MYSTSNNRQKSPEKRFLFVLGFIRIAFFLVLGILVAFTDYFPFYIGREYKTFFGIILIVYSIGRVFMEFHKRKNRD